MNGKVFVGTGLFFVLLVCLLMPSVSAPYVSHIPVRNVFGTQVETLYVEGKFPGLECVVVSGDGFRDALLGAYGVDPYLNSATVGLVEPYDLFCGYDGQMIGAGNSVGVCYIDD